MHYNTAAVVVEGMEEDYKMAAAIDTLMNDNSPSHQFMVANLPSRCHRVSGPATL